MLSLRSLAALLGLASLLGGCGQSPSSGPEDVPRFDARDTMIDPRRDAPAWDSGADVAPTVDVIPFDATPPSDSAGEVSAPADVGSEVPQACEALAEDYAAAVAGASQSCTAQGDCRALVCETLCCACEVYVNPSSTTYPSLLVLRDRWMREGCASTVHCPRPACARPTSAACSGEGRCVTIRAVVPDAGP